MRRDRRLCNFTRLSAVAVASVAIVGATASSAFAAGQFTQGDLVIYEVQGTSSAASPVSLVDYSTAGTPSGFSVALPTTASGSNHMLTESGSALNDGELTLSADGQSLIATGYNAASGTASITGATNTPRTVAIVSPTGVVDTTTSLSDTTTEAQNFRSATTAVTGGNIYVGSGGGTGITTDGGTSATYLTPDKVHEVQVVDGQLYESTTKNIFSVGSGLPTSGTPTTTALLSGANLPTNFGPDQFALVTLGTGSTPNTLYVADGSNGAAGAGPNAVEKYSLESGVWTATGSVPVPLVTGLAVSVSGRCGQYFCHGGDDGCRCPTTRSWTASPTARASGAPSAVRPRRWPPPRRERTSRGWPSPRYRPARARRSAVRRGPADHRGRASGRCVRAAPPPHRPELTVRSMASHGERRGFA